MRPRNAPGTRSRPILAALAALLLGGCILDGYIETRSKRIVEAEKQKPDRRTLGAARFVFDDLGGLNTDTLDTNAFPWKVVVTAMVMEHAAARNLQPSAELIPAIFRQYGWITPERIDNWPGATQPVFDRPIGIVAGELRRDVPPVRMEVANMGCAACHAGMSYDARGNPTGRVWLGSPNTSRYFDGYTRAILSALRYTRHRHEALLATIPRVFPAVTDAELRTIRKYVLPQITKRLQDADAEKEILVLFDHGGAGLTNGIAALKLRLAPDAALVGPREHGYASIPDLYGRRLRSSVLYDGLYALDGKRRFVERKRGDFGARDANRLASIVAFFVVPSMGIKPTVSERQAKRVGDILHFVLDYRPQPFPGTIDRGKALAGSRLFASRCAECHGRYAEGIDHPALLSYPNRLVPQEEINTDPGRWQAITDDMVDAINRTPVARRVNAASARGYVPPILNGLWASAPYLHNGSVPTLWHLMHPEQRPARFLVGGHKLDLTRVGIALQPAADGTYRYPRGYRPWSEAVLFDASGPGRGNRGHEREFEALAEDEKDQLIEFLKVL